MESFVLQSYEEAARGIAISSANTHGERSSVCVMRPDAIALPPPAKPFSIA